MRDYRIEPMRAHEQHVAHDCASWQATFDVLTAESDATWLIAPETGGTLERLSRHVMQRGKTLLGCAPDAVAITASKLATAHALGHAVAVVPTSRLEHAQFDGECVVKPDDGCGCEDTHRFSSLAQASAWLANREDSERFVVQPYVPGGSLSLSVLARGGRASLLCVNRQHIALRENAFQFNGCAVNATQDTDGRYGRLAQATIAAVPGLWGYVGIDVLDTADGPVVMEINPRLTTSYAGLHAAIGVNPALLVLRLLDNDEALPAIAQGGRAIEVNAGQSDLSEICTQA